MTNTPKALAAQRARYRANVAKGLTVYGTPRKNYRWPELDGLSPIKRRNERIRICTLRARRAKKSGGFIFEARKRTPAEWRIENMILKAQIEDAAAGIAAIFHELPPKVKVRCLALAESLVRIKRRLA